MQLLAQQLVPQPRQEEVSTEGLPTLAPPKLSLPAWHPGDDIGDFLDHFEAVANSYHMTEVTRSLYLSSLLTGKAREAFNNLPTGSTYAELKFALHCQFSLSPRLTGKSFGKRAKVVESPSYNSEPD